MEIRWEWPSEPASASRMASSDGRRGCRRCCPPPGWCSVALFNRFALDFRCGACGAAVNGEFQAYVGYLAMDAVCAGESVLLPGDDPETRDIHRYVGPD